MEQFTIDRLGHQGDGIATGPVFVPGALPGEIVEGERDGQVLRDVRIVAPSAARVSAPCRHARSCGGCQLQHASDAFVREWKRDVVRRALAAQGLEIDVPMPETSPPRSRRRAIFSARRTKKGALAGFHQKASDIVVSVPDCLLVTPRVLAALPLVEALARIGASRKGALSVAVTETGAGLDIAVRGGKPVDGVLQAELAELARRHDVARVAWADEIALTLRPATQDFDGIAVIPPPGSFLQATRHGEARLREVVLAAVAGAKHVVDLFAGCGTFSLPAARRARVHAVESEAAMLRALDQGWRQAEGLRQVTHEVRDLFRNPLLPDELARFDAAIIDPPRAGAEAQVAQLARSGIRRIAHVSCNPVTFARDTAVLVSAGFSLTRIAVVDQFRWSTHVETVAVLERD